jgi:hypothetical protein
MRTLTRMFIATNGNSRASQTRNILRIQATNSPEPKQGGKTERPPEAKALSQTGLTSYRTTKIRANCKICLYLLIYVACYEKMPKVGIFNHFPFHYRTSKFPMNPRMLSQIKAVFCRFLSDSTKFSAFVSGSQFPRLFSLHSCHQETGAL